MTPKTTLAVPLLALLVALGWASPALQSGDGDQETQASAEERRAAQIEKLKIEQAEKRRIQLAKHVVTLRNMQGAWQLIELRSATLPDPGRQDAAFVVVAQEFMTVELHMGYFDENRVEVGSYMQSGTYRLNFDIHGKLVASCLIGSVDDRQGGSIPRTPGFVSLYEVKCTADKLVMFAEDTSRFEFERVASGVLTELLFEETDWLPGAAAREQRVLAREAASK